MSSDLHAGIFRYCSKDKESVLGLDAEFFHFDLVVGDYAVASKEGADAFRRGFFGGEKGIAKFLFEIAVQVEIGTARIDEQASGVVIDEKGKVHAFTGDFDPVLALAALFPFPDQRPVVIAGTRGDRSDHRVGTSCKAADFYHANGSAPDFRKRNFEDQTAALEQPESVEEEGDSGAEADRAPDDQAGGVGVAVDED